MRTSKRSIKVASFYCDDASSSDCESDSEEQNVRMQVKEIEAIEAIEEEQEDAEVSNEEEDFYIIKEEVKEEIVE